MTTQYTKTELATIIYKSKYKGDNDLILYYHYQSIHDHIYNKLFDYEKREVSRKIKF